MKSNITQPKADKPEYLKTKNRNVRRLSTTGNYFLWFKINGKRHQPSLATFDYEQACLLADEEIRKLKQAAQNGVEVSNKSSFAELLDLYETSNKNRVGLVTKEGIKEKTFKTSIKTGIDKVRNECSSWLKRDANKITFAEIKSYCDEVGKKTSPTTYNRVVDTIRGAFEIGVDKNRLFSNPAAKLKRAEPNSNSDAVISESQYVSLVEWIKASDDLSKNDVLDLVEFLYYFGTRIEATRNFLKSDVVEFVPGTNKNIVGHIRIQKEFGKRAKQDMMMPIVRQAAPLITRLLARTPKTYRGKVIRKEHLLPIGEAYDLLNKAYKALKFDDAICGHHHFRHLAATNWRRGGLDYKLIGRLLGHSTSDGGKLAMRLYAHILPSDMENEMGKVTKHYEGHQPVTAPTPLPAPAEALGTKIVVAGKTYSHNELEALVKRAEAFMPKQIAA